MDVVLGVCKTEAAGKLIEHDARSQTDRDTHRKTHPTDVCAWMGLSGRLARRQARVRQAWMTLPWQMHLYQPWHSLLSWTMKSPPPFRRCASSSCSVERRACE